MFGKTILIFLSFSFSFSFLSFYRNFTIQLENPHVIHSSQVWVGIVTQGPTSFPLNSSYRTRDSSYYRTELGEALGFHLTFQQGKFKFNLTHKQHKLPFLIVHFTRIVPDGLLVFFPSYGLLSSCTNSWKDISNNVSNFFLKSFLFFMII
jgi:regulator of telomere elongation helicase 1